MKRVFGTIIALMMITVMASGCDAESSSMLMCVESSTANGYEMTYEKFNGKKSHKVSVKGDNGGVIIGVVTTKSGSLQIEITDSDGNLCYTSEQFTADGSFEYKTEKSGRYKVMMIAQEHSGSIEVECISTGESNA